MGWEEQKKEKMKTKIEKKERERNLNRTYGRRSSSRWNSFYLNEKREKKKKVRINRSIKS